MDSKPTILCGIAGGIAVYKTVDTVSRLHKAGNNVQVVMTPAAQKFVSPLSFQAVLGHAVGTAPFAPAAAETKEDIYPHLYPAGNADLFVVMPATADIISKLANGQADDLVCGSALGISENCIKVFCPAMNTNMWQKPVVRQNAERLCQNGWIQIGPEEGSLACGTTGSGRMTEPVEIADRIHELLKKKADLAGKHILILSGPTHEHIDPVRFIGNASSGKMGKALAEAATSRGAAVTFITGPVAQQQLPQQPGIHIIRITSAREMLEAAQRYADQADTVIFAAAVADYAPAAYTQHKRPKQTTGLSLELTPTPDIAATIAGTKKDHQYMIGFALQDQDAQQNAHRKLQQKNLDAIILNSLDAMGAEQADYQCITATQIDFSHWGILTKPQCAQEILNLYKTEH